MNNFGISKLMTSGSTMGIEKSRVILLPIYAYF